MEKTERQLQKERTRELILKTSYDLFCKNGFLNTRMSDIAKECKVSHGTVFLHFKSQDTLIFQVVSLYCKKIAEKTSTAFSLKGDCAKFLDAHLEVINEYEDFYVKLMTENTLLPVLARDEWINMQSIISHHFISTFENVLKEELRNVPSFFLYNMWIGLVHHYLANSDLYSVNGCVIKENKKLLIENYLMLILK